MPRFAILSDIHANLEALTAVLRALESHHIDQILNLGDSVGYNANPTECLDLLNQHNALSVSGNHDRAAAGLSEPHHFTDIAQSAIYWTRSQLSPAHKSFLANLPITLSPTPEIVLVHAALHPTPNDEQRITSEHIAHKSFQQLKTLFPTARICFFGHTHHPAAYAHHHITTHAPLSPTIPKNGPRPPSPLEGEGGGEGDSSHVQPTSSSPITTLTLRPDHLYLINPGSIGQPRGQDLRAAYAIYDTTTQTIEFHRADYDLLTTRAKRKRSGILPRHPLLSRLSRLIRIR